MEGCQAPLPIATGLTGGESCGASARGFLARGGSRIEAPKPGHLIESELAVCELAPQQRRRRRNAISVWAVLARWLICHHALVEGEKFPPAPEGCLAASAASSPAEGSGTARGAQGEVGSTARCPRGEINGSQAARSSLPFMGRWGQAERSGWRGAWEQEPSLWLHEEPQSRSCGTCPEGHGFLNYLLPGGFFGPRGPISRGGQRAAPLTWVTCARTGGEKPGGSWEVPVCLLGNYPSQVLYLASSSQ